LPPPIETTEDRTFQTESAGKLDDVATASGLLAVPHEGIGNEAGWTEPASIWGDDPRSCPGQDRSHLIEGVHVVGEAVRQDYRPAIGWTVFDIGDPQDIGLDASHRLLIHKRLA
jgi:hypothetical protein